MGYNTDRLINNGEYIFSNYGNMNCVHRIIFIWNNTTKDCPIQTQNYPKVIQMNALKNSLCNRYILPYENIDTDIVLTVDDDVFFTESTILNMINLYVANPCCIIGASPRCYDLFGNYWKQPLKNKNCFKLTIGQCMMFNKKYMLEFRKYPDLHDLVDNGICYHCDDIVFQFVILNSDENSNVLTVDKWDRYNLNNNGGCCQINGWNKIRNNTIKYCIKYFNMKSNLSKQYNISHLLHLIKIYPEIAKYKIKEKNYNFIKW